MNLNLIKLLFFNPMTLSGEISFPCKFFKIGKNNKGGGVPALPAFPIVLISSDRV